MLKFLKHAIIKDKNFLIGLKKFTKILFKKKKRINLCNKEKL